MMVYTATKLEGKSDISIRNNRIGSLQASSKTNTKAKITPTINSLIKFCNLVQKKTFTKKETLFNGSTFYVKPNNHKAYRQVCVMEFSPKASKTEFVLKFVHTFRGYV